MPRNEDGEMELVLGNKQLLSVLFILVVLLGVFFTMGYIVGRNNPSEDKIRLAAAKQQLVSANKPPPVTVDPSSGTVTTKPNPATEKPAPAEPVTVEPAKKQAEKKEEPPKKEETKKEPEKKKETAKKEPEKKKEAPRKPEPVAAPVESAGGLFQQSPAAGQYLQVAAIDRPGATGMAEAYRKQGFPALITPSSSPTLFRVVIGPLKNAEAVADTKGKLKKIGVEGAILRKF